MFRWRRLIRVVNTGGTFNKKYDPIAGKLVVPTDDEAVKAALKPMGLGCETEIVGLIYKDSLEMDDSDRNLLCRAVCDAATDDIVVVHGTDTMHISAETIFSKLKNGAFEKRVVLTGSMIPFSIDPIEATANLTSAVVSIRFLKPGVYIAMHGLVLPYYMIKKNRKLGIFEQVKK